MKKVQKANPIFSSVQSLVHEEYDNILTIEVSKEFSADWEKQREGEWICPLCNRPYHKEQGPFFYGMKADKTENESDPLLYSGGTVTIWVRVLGCWAWHQSFPYQDIKKGTVNPGNIHPVLQEVFSHLQKKKRLKLSIKKLQ